MPISMSNTTLTFNDATTQTTAATAAFPSGTVILFYQAAAPTGWTQVTTQNNKALRVVSGTGAGTGGSVDFTTAFVSQAVTITAVSGTAGATTLSTPQIPSHNHVIGTRTAGGGKATAPRNVGPTTGGTFVTVYSDSTGGSGSHDHPFSFTSATANSINLAVQYIDIIIASKN